MTANNDAQVRIYDAENFACLNRFSYAWSVNVSAITLDALLAIWFIYLFFISSVVFLIIVLISVHGSSQNTSVSPDGKLLAILGDSAECLIVDAQSGKVRNLFLVPIKLFGTCIIF